MIFLLTNTVTGEIIYLPEKNLVTLGRKECDILFKNDASISRQHAVFRVKDDSVILVDCSSKYGTLHNGNKVDPKVEITLQHMDNIRFGVYNNRFCFESHNFIVAASALSSDKKATLRQNLNRCRGKYVDKWSSHCTHLTVDRLTLTIKVLQALVEEKHIVTVDYWADYARSIEQQLPLPDINEYNKPPVGEQMLRSDFEYKADSGRRTLFNNKLFVFLKSSTKKQMEEIIKSCGGSCISWEDEPKTSFDIKRSPVEHLMVKAENDAENVSFDEVIKDLAKQEKRPIPINEIALAIIHCSCDVNCNPSFNKVSTVLAAPTPKLQKGKVLAVETPSYSEQFLPSTSGIKTERMIPATVEDDWMVNANTKENVNQEAGCSTEESKHEPIMNKNDNQVAGSSGVKRPIQEKSEEKEPKKMKLEPEMKAKSKQPQIDAFIEKQPSNTSVVENEASKNKPQPSQKRKAVEEAQASTSRNPNPFSSIKPTASKKSRVNEENPFELTRPSKPSPSKSVHSKNEDNPFANIVCSRNSSRLMLNLHSSVEVCDIQPKEEPKREIKLIPMKSNSFGMSSTKRSLLNTSWISKNSATIKTIKEEEEDPDLAKISKLFKDSVKVEVLPMFERSTSNVSWKSSDDVDGKKNFKKFKKVKPLKPQVTIIARHHLKKIAPGDITGIEINDKDSDDEESPGKSKANKGVKPVGKRFIL